MAGDTTRYSTASPVNVQPDNPLTVLIHRLEAATSRLEDIASESASSSIEAQAHGSANGSISAQGGMAGAAASSSMPDLDQSREDSTTTVQPTKEPLPARIEEMDQLIDSEVQSFLDASSGLDSLIEEQVGFSKAAMNKDGSSN